MAGLTSEIINQLQNLLTPHLSGGEWDRRGILARAFGTDHPIINQLDFSGAGGAFTLRLIMVLDRFGDVEPSRPALWVFLESLQPHVGYNIQIQIDAFYPLLNTATQTPQPVSKPQLGDRWTEPKTGLKMVYVPQGEFMMGSDNGFNEEKPIHKIRITQGFWIGLTPVTNASYAKFIAARGYATQSYWTLEGWKWRQEKVRTGPYGYRGFDAPNQPRVSINWYEAFAFCNWAGLRLPTEAEWEYAASGPENRVYPWGNDFDPDRAIYEENSGGITHAVGEGIRESGASWCGALDMAGNVWEWCADWHQRDYYSNSSSDSPSGPISGEMRVVRGGSWGNNPICTRTTHRHPKNPIDFAKRNGFRCIKVD